MKISKVMSELLINSKHLISEIQRQFNSLFPFLKIEFFRQPPVSGIGNARNKMILLDLKLSEILNSNKNGKINLTNKTTVKNLERQFEKDFGLYVQVFRKSGKIWLETTATDNWTLEQQNEEGRSLEEHLKEERENPDDHDVY